MQMEGIHKKLKETIIPVGETFNPSFMENMVWALELLYSFYPFL